MSLMSTCKWLEQAASIVEDIFEIHSQPNGYQFIALMEGCQKIPKYNNLLVVCQEMQVSSRKSVGRYRIQQRKTQTFLSLGSAEISEVLSSGLAA